jgi:hypothetical protein
MDAIPSSYAAELERANALVTALRARNTTVTHEILEEADLDALALALAQTVWVTIFTIARLAEIDADELWQSIALVHSTLIDDAKKTDDA